MKSEQLYLADILKRIERIERSTEVGKSTFFANEEKQDAVIRNFEVIGEAIKQLSVSTRDKRPEADWKGFMGFRDILIHQYDKVIVEEIWETIKIDLPVLKLAVSYLLENSTPKA